MIKSLRQQLEQEQDAHRGDRQMWKERLRDMFSKLSSTQSVLQLEQWHWAEAQEELITCRDEIERAHDAAHSSQQESQIARRQLTEAAAAAALAEATAADHAAAAAARLQAALSEQDRLKEQVAVQGLRSTMLMQEQLQLLKQLDDVKGQKAT